MMADNGSSERVLTGRVVSVNEKGLKFEGAGEWCNVSKFAVGVVLPERGQDVRVTVDKAGFLRSCELVDGAVSTNGRHLDTGNGRHLDTPSATKDRTITRLAVLKAAAEFSASKANATSGDVLKIAASWERWVLRDTDPVDELVDAS